MANRIVAVEYTSDAGNTFVTGLNEEVFDALNGAGPATMVGGAAAPANAAYDPLPHQMKPRRVVAYNPAGRSREIICLEPTAPLYAVGASITLEDSDGAATVYTVQKVKPEEYRRRRQQT